MSYNRWLYVYGNPINRIDPSGYQAVDIAIDFNFTRIEKQLIQETIDAFATRITKGTSNFKRLVALDRIEKLFAPFDPDKAFPNYQPRENAEYAGTPLYKPGVIQLPSNLYHGEPQSFTIISPNPVTGEANIATLNTPSASPFNPLRDHPEWRDTFNQHTYWQPMLTNLFSDQQFTFKFVLAHELGHALNRGTNREAGREFEKFFYVVEYYEAIVCTPTGEQVIGQFSLGSHSKLFNPSSVRNRSRPPDEEMSDALAAYALGVSAILHHNDYTAWIEQELIPNILKVR